MDFLTLIKNQFLTDLREYHPKQLSTPQQMIDIPSAWKGLEQIIEDIVFRFGLQQDRCIEFGVEFGYSAVVFSNYFKQVRGVDTFEGDEHTTNKEAHYEKTRQSLQKFTNIELIKSDYRDWIATDTSRYDFAHVDIVHNYKETFECGLWAAQHSDCTVFHDTESFPEVKRAVIDIAKKTGQKSYNYPHHHGLGILVDLDTIRKKPGKQ